MTRVSAQQPLLIFCKYEKDPVKYGKQSEISFNRLNRNIAAISRTSFPFFVLHWNNAEKQPIPKL
jgi:hypothetical protein